MEKEELSKEVEDVIVRIITNIQLASQITALQVQIPEAAAVVSFTKDTLVHCFASGLEHSFPNFDPNAFIRKINKN